MGFVVARGARKDCVCKDCACASRQNNLKINQSFMGAPFASFGLLLLVLVQERSASKGQNCVWLITSNARESFIGFPPSREEGGEDTGRREVVEICWCGIEFCYGHQSYSVSLIKGGDGGGGDPGTP